jgi:toxoflavin synthase
MTVDDPAAQFDQLGEVYDVFSTSPFRRHLEFPAALGALGDVTGRAVLDLGCGSGVYSRMLRRRGAEHVVGVDPMAGMVEHARSIEEATPLGIDYHAGVVPAALDGTFDAVLSVYVLPYTADAGLLADFARTAARVLRPGGRLVTLPANPGLRRERDYYERYGFRTYGASAGTDPDPITLDLCYADLDETIAAWVWSAGAIEAALAEAGFTGTAWSAPTVTRQGIEEMGTEFWQPYLDCPHSLILTSTLGRFERV